ncbi:hypothetical protein CC1G_12832 [Coprinopsis cinerea okayama7|uniref:Uncharacterized protein n=1 Tax=Coprinopsis cinerea (strain Okayama-7 / 130 / ATCC MYA-4618 / FGSC 9003) TaxID=240176 RepID=A8NJI8_COPC7|nr:hypothetical protein CC1G_12832 [Coprinopsis cinerea okayama7\|eukprot:XP_001834235.2 hypothetical protein CC1G_12832 [Coprinopsis cinerea okayama7\
MAISALPLRPKASDTSDDEEKPIKELPGGSYFQEVQSVGHLPSVDPVLWIVPKAKGRISAILHESQFRDSRFPVTFDKSSTGLHACYKDRTRQFVQLQSELLKNTVSIDELKRQWKEAEQCWSPCVGKKEEMEGYYLQSRSGVTPFTSPNRQSQREQWELEDAFRMPSPGSPSPGPSSPVQHSMQLRRQTGPLVDDDDSDDSDDSDGSGNSTFQSGYHTKHDTSQ